MAPTTIDDLIAQGRPAHVAMLLEQLREEVIAIEMHRVVFDADRAVEMLKKLIEIAEIHQRQIDSLRANVAALARRTP